MKQMMRNTWLDYIKRGLVTLMALALLSSLVPASAAGSLERIKATGKLVVATSPDYAPYEFPDKDGKPVGADMALAQYLADYLGVELVVDAYDFDGVLAAIAMGKVDLALAGLDPTPERALSMDFSDIYYNESNQLLLVKKDQAETLNSLAAFEGKLVAAQNGSVQEKMVQDFLPGAIYEPITKVPDGVMLLLSGKVSGLALASVVAEQYISSYPDLAICEEAFPYTSPGIAVALPKGQEDLLAAVNQALAQVVEQKLFYTWMEEAVELANELSK